MELDTSTIEEIPEFSEYQALKEVFDAMEAGGLEGNEVIKGGGDELSWTSTPSRASSPASMSCTSTGAAREVSPEAGSASPEGQWEILKSNILGYEEWRSRRDEDERAAELQNWHAERQRRLSTIDLWPKQHDCTPDYIKMYVWGQYLQYHGEIFEDEDGDQKNLLEDDGGHSGYEELSDDDDRSVHGGDPRQPVTHEIQFLDQEVIEELDLNMAAHEEPEFHNEPFEVAIDSGAGEHVTSAKDAPSYSVEPSRGSRVGQNFVNAGGGKMPNRGQVHLSLRAGARARGKGKDVKTTFQVADVKRPLWSVSKICDAGYKVIFEKEFATVLDPKGKECIRFERRGGLYVARLMLRNPKHKSDQDFPRPGK